MPTNWKGQIGPVTIHHIQGNAWVLPTLARAAEEVARRHLNPVDRFPGLLARLEVSPYGQTGRSVILTDECGLPIPLWRIEAALQEIPEPYRLPYHLCALERRGYDHERDFRKAPVPGVHRRSWGHSYRRIRTQGERRDIFGLEADLKDLEEFPVRVKIRARRKCVPTLWDDIMPARHGDGWKNYRKTQFKT